MIEKFAVPKVIFFWLLRCPLMSSLCITVIFVLIVSIIMFLQVEMKAGWQKGHAHWWVLSKVKINLKCLAATHMVRTL